MKNNGNAWLIHGFALLHLVVAVVCKTAGLSDTLLLTLLTMTLTVFLCLRMKYSLVFTAAAIVLVNIVGYFAGVGLAALIELFLSSPVWQSGLATFLTTELIGWGLLLLARSGLGSDKSLVPGDKQMMVLIIGIAIVYVVRVLLNVYFSGDATPAEIVGNSLALLIFVADVVFISRFVTPQVSYKERHIVKVGDRIVPIQTEDIACFVSEHKGTYLICLDGAKYVINPSLDEVSEGLDPVHFFRISRSAIISKKAVRGAEREPNGKLVLETTLADGAQAHLEVSRARVDAFLSWLES